MKKIFFFLCIPLFISSCFHKSVETGEADNIMKVLIYQGKEGAFMITTETIFQASSKSSGGGVTKISGHNDLRISSYDINTGKLSARDALGGQMDNSLVILGCSEGNVWCYSFDSDLGFHSRDPKTLEVKVTQEKFFEKNPKLKDALAKCEWYSIDQFFAFNVLTKKILVTDNQGYRYAVDPVALVAEKLPEGYSMPYKNDRYMDGNGEINLRNISFKGDLRKSIEVNNKTIDNNSTFLEPQFLMNLDVAALYASIKKQYQFIKAQDDSIQTALTEIAKKYGEFDEKHKRYNLYKYSDADQDKYRLLTNDQYTRHSTMENFERTIKEMDKSQSLSSTKQFLSPDTTSVFVVHKSNTAKDAKLLISRISIKNGTELKELWKTQLEDVFYDADAAEETDAFKKVFSKGSPDFGFKYFNLVDNKLLVIYGLYAHCLDIKTGKVLWKFRF